MGKEAEGELQKEAPRGNYHISKWIINANEMLNECVAYLSLLEGGVRVMTDVGDGWVGFIASYPKCRGSDPGRTMVGVGVALAAAVLGGTSCLQERRKKII